MLGRKLQKKLENAQTNAPLSKCTLETSMKILKIKEKIQKYFHKWTN